MTIIGCLLSYLQLFTVQAVYTCSVLSNLSVKNNTKMIKMHDYQIRDSGQQPGLEVIKLEFILRLKIKRNDWLLADTCPQAANHCVIF